MLSLSASQPTVSATRRISVASRAHRAKHLVVDALDQIVAPLIELVDVPLRGGDLVVVACTRLVLLVPELDVRARELRDERADRLRRHGHGQSRRAMVRSRAARG